MNIIICSFITHVLDLISIKNIPYYQIYTSLVLSTYFWRIIVVCTILIINHFIYPETKKVKKKKLSWLDWKLKQYFDSFRKKLFWLKGKLKYCFYCLIKKLFWWEGKLKYFCSLTKKLSWVGIKRNVFNVVNSDNQ